MSELAQIQTDYHIHSTFSPDGNDTPEVLCRQALEPVIRNTLASLVRYDHALELNTRFLARQPNWNDAIVTIR